MKDLKNLLNKELKLVIHPTSLLFLCLSAMLLIPDYPYQVTFFYTTLGLFFTCLGGRENNDIFFTMTLPVRKKDTVRARFIYFIFIELLQMLSAIPFAILRTGFSLPGNQAGMDANLALFGLGFGLFGVFNLTFLSKYYKNPDNVGKSFVLGATFVWIYIILTEACTFVVPFFKDKLDTPDPQFMGEKFLVLAVGVVIYALFTAIGYKKSVKEFEKIDL